MLNPDQDRQEDGFDAKSHQENTDSEEGSWAGSDASEQQEAALLLSDHDVLQLNVGGTMFTTIRRTLTQVSLLPACKLYSCPTSLLQPAQGKAVALGLL